MKTTAVCLTCKRDAVWLDAMLAGMAAYWPEMPVRVFMDDDPATETDLPADVREVVRRIPYLKKIFDFPLLTDADLLYYIDSDCLLLRKPAEWQGPMYQPTTAQERGSVLSFWKEMGWHHRASPRFCAGLVSYEPKLFIDNRGDAIEWIRMMVRYGRDRLPNPGVECEQGLTAGLWLANYPDRPLPIEAYPYWQLPKGDAAIWHAGEAKNEPAGQLFLREYMTRFDDRQCR